MSDAVVAVQLRHAFLAELDRRVPRLAAASSALGEQRTVRVVRSVMADAHALASSAVVVGASLAAGLARDCEDLLAPYCRLPEDVGLPVGVAQVARSLVDALCDELGRWSARAG